MSSPVVPRRAVFDDLQPGQIVAWLATSPKEQHAGTVTRVAASTLVFNDHRGGQWHVPRSKVDDGEVTILAERPAPPVTVPRELIDALDAATRAPNIAHGVVYDAARAVVDHASEGNPT